MPYLYCMATATTTREIEMTTTLKATANIEVRNEDGRTVYVVSATWGGAAVDRTESHGTCLLNKRVAERLAAAINAGVVFTNPKIATDINGRTYVAADCAVIGKYANSNLKRLGY